MINNVMKILKDFNYQTSLRLNMIIDKNYYENYDYQASPRLNMIINKNY